MSTMKWPYFYQELKCTLFYFDMLITFCFEVSSNLSQQKSPTAEILRIYFLGTIVRRKYLPKISAVGLFYCDKFEETPKQKVIDLAQLKKIHFSTIKRASSVEIFFVGYKPYLESSFHKNHKNSFTPNTCLFH